MYKDYFINEVNNLLTDLDSKGYKLSDYKISFAISILLLSRYGLLMQYNDLMEIYKQGNVITVDAEQIN